MVMFFAIPVRAADNDSRIKASVRESYVFRTYLQDDNIDVDVKDGVVTLTGTVANDDHKSLAEETSESVEGVKKVDNQLETREKMNRENNADAWIIMKVKAALLFHRNVSGTSTEVYVKDSVVTLRGEAGSQAEKDLASEYAKDIDGVKSVDNAMSVASTPRKQEDELSAIDDASITAQVKMMLLTHRSTSALKTSVATDKGVVTVKGAAQNAAEKDLVTKLASDVRGVKKVVNEMEVKNP
jgi:osmotically-inducible protein OsmY